MMQIYGTNLVPGVLYTVPWFVCFKEPIKGRSAKARKVQMILVRWV